jgi:hypothetical protein
MISWPVARCGVQRVAIAAAEVTVFVMPKVGDAAPQTLG